MKAGIEIVSLLASLPLLRRLRFKTMKIPPEANVQIEGSAAKISGGGLGIETIWNCSCTKGEGTCTIHKSAGAIACSKGAADTCRADCFLSLDSGGFLKFAPGTHRNHRLRWPVS